MKALSTRAQEILELLEGVDTKAVIAALEDGEALTAMGISDEDQEAVEELHSFLKISLTK